MGLLGILPTTRFDVDHASYGVGGGGDAGYFTPAATLAYVHSVNDRLRFGVMAGRYYVQDGKFLNAGINPSIGYSVTDWLSVGGSVTMEAAKLYNQIAVNTLLPGRSDGVDPVKIPEDANYHFLTDMIDQSVAWVQQFPIYVRQTGQDCR